MLRFEFCTLYLKDLKHTDYEISVISWSVLAGEHVFSMDVNSEIAEKVKNSSCKFSCAYHLHNWQKTRPCMAA